MKKIFILMMAMVLTVSSFAQTVKPAKVSENFYVGVEAGATTPMVFNGNYGDFGRRCMPVLGVEIGKDITPVVGFSIEALAAFNTNKDVYKAAINNTNIIANAKFNMMNLFGGYKGEPRLFEVLVVPGIGWGHMYDYDNANIPTTYKNYATYNAYAQMNFNLGKNKEYCLYVKPGVTYNGYKFNDAAFSKYCGDIRVTVGFVYRFKNKRTCSHNFVYSDAVARSEYNSALAEIERLKNRKTEVTETIKEVVKEVSVEKIVYIPNSTLITFEIGSTKLSGVEKAKLHRLISSTDKDIVIDVTGSADLKTGSKKRNDYLAQERAKVVKSVLVNDLGIDESRITVNTSMDIDENAEASRAAEVRVSVK